MIKIEIREGEEKFQVSQPSPRPWIYLDHWALRKISSDPKLKEKFLELMEQKNATLCISTINFLEILNHDTGKSLDDIKSFYKELGNRFSFIKTDPVLVIEHERLCQTSPHDIMAKHNPAHDDLLLTEYFKRIFATTFNNISFTDIIEYVISDKEAHEKLKQTLASMKNSALLEELKIKRLEYIADKKSLTKKNRLKSPHDVTEYIYQETIKQFIKNCSAEPNDIPDIFNTIVPTAYCDFVLLETKWAGFVRKTNPKIGSVSRIYTQKNIGQFFNDFELFTKTTIGAQFQ
jgi:hypothetical protein